MFNRRRVFLAITVVGCLLVVSSASADPLDTFTATSAPTHVKPSTSVAYTIALTTNASAPHQAQQAKIAIPSGFTINGASVLATTSAAGTCNAATWVADGALIANGKINLKRPGGNPTGLCPGATLTVGFPATSAAVLGSYAWTSELFYDATGAFTLTGSQPSVVVDGTAPTVAVTGPPNPTNSTSASLAFTASEPSTFLCKLDTAPLASCTSPRSYTPLNDGSHTFAVVATDTAGNVGNTTSYTWTIDTLPSTATITLKPSNPSSTNSPIFAFIASEGGSFTCRLDGGAFAPCTSPTTYSNVGDGPHSFAVRATDLAGNTGPEAGHTWTIETRAPTAALTSAPSPLSNSSAATFAFSADEPSSFECALDGRGFEQCSSPATYHGLGHGQHAFRVRARDAVGNFSPAVSHSWAIDTTVPETTLASGPKPVTTVTSATFAFSASESGSFECRLDGAPFAPCGSPKSYSGLAKGDHSFEVRAIDAAGNADATPALHAWKIQAPVRITTSALLAPRSGARVTKPPLLVWRRVTRAGYYNVQLFRGKQKILSAWPTRARLRLRARWKFAGRVRRLTPGTYRWYVWPGYGVPSARNYGQLLGQSTFVVARSVRR
jgi:large repetitive protein